MTTADESESKYVDYLNFTISSWKRPKAPPRIWRVFEGRKKREDGEIPRFSIQEVPKELENDVVDFMVKYFVPEEVLCVDQDLADNPLGVREARTMWRDIVSQGVSVVALTVNSDPAVKPEIVAVNILGVIVAEDEANPENKLPNSSFISRFKKFQTFANSLISQFQTKVMKKLMGVQFKLVEEADILRRYGVDRYFSAFGLSVHPSLRGQGLGQEILLARHDIGLAYQIPVSETIFTSTPSQILAVRAGFEVLIERKYSELLDDEGKVAFPSVTEEFIKVMGKRLY